MANQYTKGKAVAVKPKSRSQARRIAIVQEHAKAPVSRAEFDEVKGGVNQILEILEAQAHERAQAVSNATGLSAVGGAKEPADIANVSQAASEKAKPNRATTNPEWEEIAKEILGEALDHTEVEHERSGGIKFTIVIKLSHSNADAQYLERNKTDRRSKEVSQEGVAGVEEWCRQVKANLSRTQKLSARQ